jgi:hypothetical protein
MMTRLFLSIGMGLLAMQVSAPSNDDVAVYQAVLKHTIYGEVDRVSYEVGLKMPAPVLTFDRTLTLCGPGSDYPREMGCLSTEDVRHFEGTAPNQGALTFEKRLSADSRRELGKSFRERNREPRQLSGDTRTGLILAPPDRFEEAKTLESKRTLGFATFSSPGYSSDGHALVYPSYTCGALCGNGWFFLLERRGQSWRVVDRVLLWIS